ncbi:MAG: N-acetylmuramoyl-L-alanine amidase family protein [Bradymonadaceae bacterium]
MRSKSKVLGIATLVLMSLGLVATAVAHPGSMRGIDVATVLTLHDHARLLAFEAQSEKKATKSLKKVRTIVIDPGHGGDNSGATGVAGIREKYLTLDLAYELRKQLQERFPEARVVMTRYWDKSMSLTERVHFANVVEADLFISLHYNAAVHDRALGFETYFLLAEDVTPGQERVQSAPLATSSPTMTGIEANMDSQLPPIGVANDMIATIQRDLERGRLHAESGLLAQTVQKGMARHLDAPDRGVKQANFGVLRGALMPAIVVEAAFLTHPGEGVEVLEKAHRKKISRALVEAVETFDRTLSERAD